jgi:putative hydrolase of the HAD superfamily
MVHKPEVIFFDVGNTLLFPDRQTILAPLLKRNIVPHPEQLRAIECRTKNEFDTLQQRGAVDHGFWYMFYSHLLDELEMKDEQLLNSLVDATRVSANWSDIRPGTRAMLKRIGRRHRIGVISNADGKIADVLERCQIADCFLTITDSGLVGHEKPHPAIFEAALRGMAAEPQHSLYVGDVYAVDYLGARQAGMEALLFDACGAYRETNLPRVESLPQLEDVLQST